MCWFRCTVGCRRTTRCTAAAFLRCLYPPHQSWQARLWKGCCVKTCASLGRSCHRPLLQRTVRILRFKLHQLPTDTLKRRCSICCHGWTKATFTPQQKKTSRLSATSTWGTSWRLSSCSVLLSHLEEFWSCGASMMSTPAEMCFRGWSTAATWCVYYDSWPSPDADFLSDINICVFSSHNHMSDEAGRKTRSPPPGNRSWQMLLKLRNWRSGGLRTIRQVYGWQTYKFINKYVKG